jgi:hypothetical protein
MARKSAFAKADLALLKSTCEIVSQSSRAPKATPGFDGKLHRRLPKCPSVEERPLWRRTPGTSRWSVTMFRLDQPLPDRAGEAWYPRERAQPPLGSGRSGACGAGAPEEASGIRSASRVVFRRLLRRQKRAESNDLLHIDGRHFYDDVRHAVSRRTIHGKSG